MANPASASTSAAAPGYQANYALLISDRPSGELVIRDHSSGQHTATFWFLDRGRGPRLRSEITIDERGVMTRLAIRGHDYWKSPVDENFAAEGGTYRWQSKSEKGESPADRPAFYVSLNGTLADLELLARALLTAPDRSLRLLPAGNARIDTVETISVQADDKRQNITLYAITGLSLTPTFLWLDDDRRLFADAGSRFALIRKGWESAKDTLEERQKQASLRLLTDIARRIPRRAEHGLVFRNVAVFDATSATVSPAMTVVVSGDRITGVGKEGTISIPADALSIDGSGHTLLPGLWDMHVHVSEEDGILHIASGVTSARDLANETESVLDIKRHYERGELIGPRLILAGFMDGTSDYTGPTKVVVDTEEQARAAIARYKELGFEQIKIYSSIKPELVPAIARLTHGHGLRLSGHIPAFMTAEQAVEQGFDEIQHANMLMLNFMFDKVKDTRTPARFTSIGDHGADLDLESGPVAAFIRLLVRRNVVVDPTIAIFENMFEARPGQMSPTYAAISEALPVLARRQMRRGGLPVEKAKDARYRASFRVMLRLIGLLHKAGVHIVAGTDAIAGFTLHRELELYVAAGIAAPEVLKLATLGSAQLMKRDRTLGSIEPGKLADLVLVKGNPAQRISDIRNTTLTVKGGVVYPAVELYRTVGVRHQLGGHVNGLQ
ncbi:MAG: amidohydrolase family protein [Proteobacteria bacterium]|nr:amidohydrolase family protein [Pseudomonadota bacterium]